MTVDKYQFRSRNDRDRDVDLSRNYGAIGNRAIAAASHDCCKRKAAEKAMARKTAGESSKTHSTH